MVSVSPKSDEPSKRSSPDRRERSARSRNLGDKLRRIYDDVVEESIPDEFMQLLENADKAERKKQSGSSSDGES